MLFLSVALAETLAVPQLPKIDMYVGQTKVSIEVADEPHERSLGLMHRESLGKNDGMLFVYAEERLLSFWMKNTQIPLSIAYIDKTGQIVHIARMTPFDLTSISSVHPAQYALEMNQGWFERNQVSVGMTLEGLPSITGK